ncbi:Retrotransposable element Tf2 155 kDa protein type 1 OS=Schizosaccharomyces pombe (strain 972 / ATCC 24843) GN=Tf2-1 PE=4 SV=1 [Rhizoctonia solani AG-1 IB]|uniref:Retrotransposable element Tf2 155 kDa protein type 1 n=1 Tax=Thanatephorus cucumeris (strain AG1-IB / isolate 7/3/14) TaxID=1108050 RepID=A0A0B7FFT2_THACB|nr:Retrotransposable element Tf2 155 kDa protein type 1 OS=Schizosaccharomyces pombe (strain 972 / ATCC 24843) GN=Tf2-1 PE=4 SV=1 [Rhizoctonia solani AG-1 IB]
MSKLQGAKIFTKLDLQWGYNNVCVKEGNKWKTAFCTKYGLFESLVMTFGLTNAPAAFQYFMNDLFQDLLDVYVIIYLDDILIFSKNEVKHKFHVHKVLQRLETAQLFCKGLKCEFHHTRVEYLGIIVSDQGFSLDKLKIQAVQEWPAPTTVKQVQSFLGFANFLRRFVANFSHMARPLHNLVKKEITWKWTEKEQEAFDNLKRAITEAPVLAHADPDKPYFLETDASGAALGSVLSQQQEDGRLHPIGFLSESFKGAENPRMIPSPFLRTTTTWNIGKSLELSTAATPAGTSSSQTSISALRTDPENSQENRMPYLAEVIMPTSHQTINPCSHNQCSPT